MRKIMGLLATGFLALAANTASAIPLQVNVTTVGVAAGGEWQLTGLTNDSGFWGGIIIGLQSWNLDIAPGDYLWEIDGTGYLAHVSWSLILGGEHIYSGSDGSANPFRTFRINDDRSFEAIQVSEPGVLLLLGGGLLAVATARRRQAIRA